MKPTVFERIAEFNANKEPRAVAVKLEHLSKDPFSFFRGTCHLFYEDLFERSPSVTSPTVWMCGDLHLGNFGSYKGKQDLVYFDLNDFDESILAPAHLEIVRLVVSIFVATRDCPQKERMEMVALFLSRYVRTLRLGKALYIERDTAKGEIKKLIKQVMKRNSLRLLKERTTSQKKGMRELKVGEKLLSLENDLVLKKALMASFQKWLGEQKIEGKVVDVGFRLAGVGSLGTHRYLFLVKENKRSYSLLDAKRAFPSCLQKGIHISQPNWKDEADRIIQIESRMQQSTPSILLDFGFQEEQYVVKKLQPTTDKINIEVLVQKPKQLQSYVKQLGILVASAQLRSSGREGSAITDELIGFASDRSWQEELTKWCLAYSKQVEEDFEAYNKVYRNEKKEVHGR